MLRHMVAQSHVSLGKNLQDLLDLAVGGDPAVHGGILLIDAPGLQWKGASGVLHSGSSTTLLADDQFIAASITKMITATALMSLVEEGCLGLEMPVNHLVPVSVLKGLHTTESCSSEDQITVRQLLNHTSGLADFFGDGRLSDRELSPFLDMVVGEPEKFWDPLETLNWTKCFLKPVGSPGQGWHYSDTGYVLLGLVIESLTGKSLHQVLRERIFQPLEMNHTYLLFRESPRPSLPGRSPSHAYMGKVNFTIPRSVSADWAGGGLMTTASDLSRFMRAFTTSRIFRDPSTSLEMVNWIPTGEQGIYYGLGIRRFLLEELDMPGYGELWGHTGFVKAFMLYWPGKNMILCGTLNQANAQGVFSRLRPVPAIIPEVLRQLQHV